MEMMTKWEIACAKPPDRQYRDLIDQGWEPFAVEAGVVWFRRPTYIGERPTFTGPA